VAVVAATVGGWHASPLVLVPVAAIGLAAALSLPVPDRAGTPIWHNGGA
jgi:hypothetical protein